jgi:TetR/AcrR family acrAB operon transcriptional repressor/TetR/AcrR family transcriptional repressor of mexAB-oprM operon
MSEKGDVREELLDASIRLFLTKGYAGATTNEIARSAGVSKGALYWYFQSKEDVLNAILDKYNSEFIDKMNEMLCGLSGDFATKFKKFFKWSSELSKDNKELLLVFITVLIEIAGSGTNMERRMKEMNKRYFLIIKDLLEEGVREGTVRKDIDPAVHGTFFWSALIGSLITWYLDDAVFQGDVSLFAKYARVNRDALLRAVLSEDCYQQGGDPNKDAS